MMRDLVSNELDRLLADDIIEPVHYLEWAAPIVPVMKADRTVKICGDYKLIVNQVAKLDQYTIPRIEDLYAQLGNGTYYTKLDMRHAYKPIALHSDCRKYVTINTHVAYLRTNVYHMRCPLPLEYSSEWWTILWKAFPT